MKKTIAIVVPIDFPWREGMSYRVENMARKLCKKYSVTIICPILESSYSKSSTYNDYNIHRFDLRFLRKVFANRLLYRGLFVVLFSLCMLKMRKFSSRISLVQSEQQLALLPATLLSLFCGTKLVIDDIASRSKYYHEHLGFLEVIAHSIETILVRRCSLVIASNANAAKEVKDTIRLANHKVRIIQNGVNTIECLSDKKTNLKTNDVVFIGSMYSDQNRRAVKNLFQMYPSISDRVKDARLVIIGGPLTLLEKTMPVQTSTENLQLLGYLSEAEKERYLRNAAVCALPFSSKDSLAGGNRLKVLDCLAHGKIVVSTPNGVGGLDGIVSGKNVIVESDLNCFLERIIDVLKHREKYTRITSNALKLAAKYDWNNLLTDYLSAMHNLLK